MDFFRLACAAALASVLASCTTPTELRTREDAELARFERHAGAPVDRINAFSGLDQWQSLAPDKLAIWISVNRVYLLTLRAPCSGLEFEKSLVISSSNNIIDRHFDKVYVDRLACFISEIRPVDYEALKQEERAGRQDS